MSDDLDWGDVGGQVRQVRLAAGLSQQHLAEAVGLDRTMIAKVEAGKRRLDAFELVRLSSALHVSMDYLLRPRPQVLSHRMDLLAEDTDSDVARVSQRLEIELVTWLREVQQLIELGVLRKQPLSSYPGKVETSSDARDAARWLRGQLGYGAEPIGSLMKPCERSGQFVLVTDVPGDGASLIEGDVAVAVVSTKGDPGRRRATAAHELGHLMVGDEYSSDLGVHLSRTEREAVIDAFAAEFLLPTRVVRDRAQADGMSRDVLVRLSAEYRTSWSLALRQAEFAGLLTSVVRRQWAASSPTKAEMLEAVGWAPQPDLEPARVPPSYADAVMTAWRRDLITSARAVELMHGQISGADLPMHAPSDVQT